MSVVSMTRHSPDAVEPDVEIASGSDEELLAEGRDLSRVSPAKWSRRPLYAAFGLFSLAACVIVLSTGFRREILEDVGVPPRLTARALLENPRTHQVVTDSLMRSSRGALHSHADRLEVHALVATGFRNISRRLLELAPEQAKVLDSVQLSEDQRDAVLRMVRLSSDPRVQSLGLTVAKAIQEGPEGDREGMKLHIMQKLQSRSEEMRRLHDELIPETLRSASPMSEHDWDLTLNANNVRVMKTFGESWNVDFEASVPTVSHQKLAERRLTAMVPSGPTVSPIAISARTLGIIGGVLEEGRLVVDELGVLFRLFGKDVNIPSWLIESVGAADVATELATCELQNAEEGFSIGRAVLCLPKLGTQGVDALQFALHHAYQQNTTGFGNSAMEGGIYRETANSNHTFTDFIDGNVTGDRR